MLYLPEVDVANRTEGDAVNFYTEFWKHNTAAAVMLHGFVLVVILAAIDGLTFERRFFNIRTRNGRNDG